jgi:hypothetical protein
VSSAEGLGENASRPLLGDHVVDGWHKQRVQRKVEVVDRWRTYVSRERSQTIFNLSHLMDS